MIDAQSGRDVWGAPPAPDPVHLRESARRHHHHVPPPPSGAAAGAGGDKAAGTRAADRSSRLGRAVRPGGDCCPSDALCSRARLIPLRNSGASPAQDPHRPRTIR